MDFYFENFEILLKYVEQGGADFYFPNFEILLKSANYRQLS